jgi:hypothetical protein
MHFSIVDYQSGNYRLPYPRQNIKMRFSIVDYQPGTCRYDIPVFPACPVPTSLPAAAQIPIPYRSQQLLRGGSDYGFLNWPTKKQPRLNPTQTTSIITHGLTLRLEICSSVLPRQYFPESLVQYLCSSEPFGMLKI